MQLNIDTLISSSSSKQIHRT